MPAPFQWTDALDQQLRDLAAQAASVRDMAADLGCSKSTIQRRLDKLGIHGGGDRTQTAAATQANAIDARARRSSLQLALLDDAARLREQLWQKALVFNFGGRDNTYEERTLDKPTFGDQLKIMQAAGAAIDRALKLDLHDSGAGAEKVVGLLQATAEALGLTDQADQQAPQ